jgi:type 1 fimbria pilin
MMILLSDGEGSQDPVATATAAKDAGTVIYCIGLGYYADTVTLKAVASDPDSDYFFFAPTGDELESIYQKIHRQIVSLAGTDNIIGEMLAPHIHYAGGASPDSFAGTGLYWSIDRIHIGDTLTYTFDIQASRGGYLPVALYPTSKVEYKDYLNSTQEVPFPEIYINVYAILLEPAQSKTVDPGQSVDYVLTVTNYAKSTDIIDMTSTGTSAGWNVEFYDSTGNPLTDHNANTIPDINSLLGSGKSASFVTRITSAPGALAHEIDRTTITARSSNATSMFDEAALTTRINLAGSVIIETDQADSTLPETAVSYALTVTNNTNGSDVVNITSSQALGDWTVELYDFDGTTLLADHDNDMIPDVGELSPGGMADIVVKVIPDSRALAYEVDTAFVTATFSNYPSISDNAILRTKVNPVVGLIVESDQTGTTFSGILKHYSLRAINNGNLRDVVRLTTSGTAVGWKSLLRDGNHLSVGPYEGEGFALVITPPEINIIGMNRDTVNHFDETVVYGHSSLDSCLYDSVIIKTAVKLKLDVHNFVSPFRERTRFIFSIPEAGEVNLIVYNRLGEKIKTLLASESYNQAGIYYAPWDARNDRDNRVAPGVYVYTLKFRGRSGFNKTLLRKTAVLPIK